MSKMLPSASRRQYTDSVRKLIIELGCLKAALAALGEWEHAESIEETIQMTRELLKQTENPLYH